MPRRQPGVTKYTTSDGRTFWQYVVDLGDDPDTESAVNAASADSPPRPKHPPRSTMPAGRSRPAASCSTSST